MGFSEWPTAPPRAQRERVGQNLVQTGPDQRPFGKQQIDQRFGIIREFVVLERRFLRENPGFGHLVVVLVKGELARQQCIEDNAQAPHVHLLACIFLSLEHLRRAVADGAAERLEIARFPFILAREPKVAQLDTLMLVQEDVFQFEIPMHTRFAVDISHRSNQLRKDPFHFLDWERAVAEEVVVEFVA